VPDHNQLNDLTTSKGHSKAPWVQVIPGREPSQPSQSENVHRVGVVFRQAGHECR
jgi:hypothetical protein